VTVLTVACYFTQHLEDTMSVEPPPEDELIILDITGPTLTELDSLDLRGKWISLRITDFQGNFSHILSDLFTAEADRLWDVHMVEYAARHIFGIYLWFSSCFVSKLT